MNTTFLDKKGYTKLYIKQAGEDRKKFWKPILKLLAILYVAVILVNIILSAVFGDSILLQLVLQLISFFISLYAIKFILNLIDNEKASLKETFFEFTTKQVLYALGAYVLYILAVYAGFILLIVPGVILSYMLMFTMLIGSEDTVKPIAALKESRRLTNDYKMKMFINSLSVGIHYMAIPIVLILASLLVGLLGLPIWLGGIFIGLAIAFSIYAQFALATLLPRMYRDLQEIKGDVTADTKEILEVEEVLEGDQTEE